MAQKVQIEIEVLNNQAKAEFDATAKEVATISDKAAESATKVKKSFEEVGKAQREAFASDQTKKALNENTKAVDKLATELEMLYKEEVRLLQLNKQSTEQYKQNRAEAERVRGEFDKLNKTQGTFAKTVVKTSQDVGKLEDQLRKLALEGKQGTKEFDDIAKAIGEYKAAITTADRAVDLYAKTTDAATGRLGELEDKLYDLAIAGKQGTQEFKDTVQEVSTLKRAVFEVDQQVDSYVERSRGLTTVVQNVELLGNAFQITEGASALFGTENEELQETLVRLNAIMVVTQGLEQTRTILLEQSAKKTGIAAVAQKAYSVAVGSSVGAMRAFRLALVATGVGAFVVALGFIVENFDRIKRAAFDLIPGLREVSEFIGGVIDKTKELLGFNENPENNFLAKLVKSQERALKAQVNNIQRQIDLQKELGKDTLALEIEKEQIQLDFAKRRLKLVQDNFTEEQAARLGLTDLIFETQQEILDRENDIRILRINNEKEITQAISGEMKKRAAIRLGSDDANSPEREAQKLLKIDQTTNEELLNQRARFLNRLELQGEGGLQNRIAIIRTEADAQIAAIRETLGFTNDANNQIAIIEAETQQKIREERQRTNEAVAAEVLKYANEVGTVFNQIADLQKEQAERRIAQIERINQVELEAIETSKSSEAQKQREKEALEVRTSRKIIEEKRKIAKLDKATGIFDAVVNTAVAITNAQKQKPPLNIILTAAASVIGATQIAKISSEPLPQFGSGGIADKGGLLKGKSHKEGGIPIEVEGGEFIVNKRRTKPHMKELVAMNTSRTAYDKLIQDMYVRPKLEQFALEFSKSNQAVNVNASLNSAQMETELKALRRETKRTGKVITTALGRTSSSRYNWN
jgi:hypothetical protein